MVVNATSMFRYDIAIPKSNNVDNTKYNKLFSDEVLDRKLHVFAQTYNALRFLWCNEYDLDPSKYMLPYAK